jgi:saccharopine dehydrogenase (NADP+, L-glutamate forming)
MGRLVSIPVSLAVESVARGEISPGVHGAPHDRKVLDSWLGQVKQLAQYMERVDHLA